LKFKVGDNAVTAMTILGNGNVGIGTASPQSRLNVFDTFSGTLSSSEGIRFTGTEGDDSNYYNIIENNISTGAASMGFFISSGDDAVARAMTIQRASVGIGIESPDGTLHVHAGSAGSVAASQYTDTLVVEDSAHGGITILMPDDQEGAISWGNPSDNSAAFLKWVYSSSTMTLGTAKAGSSLVLQSANAATALTLDSSQNATFAGKINNVGYQTQSITGNANTRRYLQLGTKDKDSIIIVELTAINANMAGGSRMRYSKWVIAFGSYSSGGYVGSNLESYGSAFSESLYYDQDSSGIVELGLDFNSHDHSVVAVVRTLQGTVPSIGERG